MLAMFLFMLVQTASDQDPGNLAKDVYYAGLDATGAKLCDRRQAARYARQFEVRYGKRIRALMRYHESRFGKDPDFIVTSSCRSSMAPMPEQDRYHRKVMDQFDARLKNLERRYGPPEAHP